MVATSFDGLPRCGPLAAIRGVIEGDEHFHHDFYLVNFHALGESSLVIFCYFFTRTVVWADYMQVREDFLLAVMVELATLDVQLAFPTRTVHLASPGPSAGTPA